jgi:hypothetical protein
MGEYTVERRAVIDAPAAELHGHIDDFHRWTAWSPWEDVDPDLQRTYAGPDRGVGARYAWTGNRKAGAGSMEIVASSPEAIDVALAFLKPIRSESTLRFGLVPAGSGTEVVWRMEGRTSGVMGVVSRFMNFDKLVGPDFEKGLARLKAVAEQTA